MSAWRGTTRPVVVLQHADWEKPGVFAHFLAHRGINLVTVRVDRGELPPPVSAVAGVLAMGGPMSVNDALPWLSPEKAYIRDAVRRGVPFFGVCLGAQLLASALGAAVGPTGPQHGMQDVRMTPGSFADPLFGGLSRALRVFQWHGENVGCPDGAAQLATSPECPYEAFRVGRAAYGVQFHLEVDPPLLAEWLAVPQCRAELGPGAPAVAAGLAAESGRMARLARRVFGGWLDIVESTGEFPQLTAPALTR